MIFSGKPFCVSNRFDTNEPLIQSHSQQTSYWFKAERIITIQTATAGHQNLRKEPPDTLLISLKFTFIETKDTRIRKSSNEKERRLEILHHSSNYKYSKPCNSPSKDVPLQSIAKFFNNSITDHPTVMFKKRSHKLFLIPQWIVSNLMINLLK